MGTVHTCKGGRLLMMSNVGASRAAMVSCILQTPDEQYLRITEYHACQLVILI